LRDFCKKGIDGRNGGAYKTPHADDAVWWFGAKGLKNLNKFWVAGGEAGRFFYSVERFSGWLLELVCLVTDGERSW
jgi:hypothetical protein